MNESNFYFLRMFLKIQNKFKKVFKIYCNLFQRTRETINFKFCVLGLRKDWIFSCGIKQLGKDRNQVCCVVQ